MKQILTLLLVSTHCFSQITTRKVATPVTSPETARYDSASNYLGESPMGYLGQDLYVKQVSESIRRYGYSGFLLDYTKDDMAKENVYLCCDSYHSKNADLAGKYFTVTDIIKHPKAGDSPYLYGNKYFFKLSRKDNQDVVYYAYDGKFEHAFPFLAVGFFEKQKKKAIGQQFVFCNECVQSETDINTGKPITQIPGQKWKCIDLTIEEKYYNLALICQNQKGEQIDVGYDYVFGKFHEGRSYTGAEADSYLKRFGSENFNQILGGKVKIGMTKEMCKLSWGTPDDINETLTAGKRSEQWVYKKNYLYFENGILTTKQ